MGAERAAKRTVGTLFLMEDSKTGAGSDIWTSRLRQNAHSPIIQLQTHHSLHQATADPSASLHYAYEPCSEVFT